MTRQEFIDKYKHEFFGLVLDASHNRHRAGAELSQWTVDMMRKVNEKLIEMYHDLHDPLGNAKVSVNNGKKETVKS